MMPVSTLTIFEIICESSGIKFSVFDVSSEGGVKLSFLTATDVTITEDNQFLFSSLDNNQSTTIV